MKTIPKWILFTVLAGILIYVMRPLREGYPYTASYTMLSTDGGLNDSVEDRLKDSPPVCIVYTREDKKKEHLDTLYDLGLTPSFVLYIPPNITKNRFDRCIFQLQRFMGLSSLPEQNIPYVYNPVGTAKYTRFYGRCANKTFKNNSDGTNC